MIIPLLVFVLLFSALILATPRRRALHDPLSRRTASGLPLSLRVDKTSTRGLHDAALLVGELAALLRAGRSQEQMWRQAALSVRRRLGDGVLDAPVRWSGSLSRTSANQYRGLRRQRLLGRQRRAKSGGKTGGPAVSAEVLGAVSTLEAAAQAAALGIPVGPAIREAVAFDSRRWFATAVPGRTRAEEPRRRMPREPGALAIWRDVAACIETAEASGCPLAAVFDRLSAHLESDADAAAARATALAGPKATTRILTVLPFVGLVLGILVGANPVEALTTTFLGFVCLLSGGLLALAGRLWSSRLVAQTGSLR